MFRFHPAGVGLAAALILQGCADRVSTVERALSQGRSQDGWLLAGESIRADSTSAAAWMSYARAALATTRTALGVVGVRRAVELSGGDPEAYLLRAYLDQRRFRNLAAVAAVDTARAAAPGHLGIVRAAGEFRLGGGMVGVPDHAGAEEAFRAALALDSTDARARFGLGKVLVLAGRHEEGTRWLDGVLVDRPAWGEAYYLRGVARMRAHDLEGAALDFAAATDFDPAEPSAWFNRARLADRMDRPEEADMMRRRASFLRNLTSRLRSAAVEWHSFGEPGPGVQLAKLLRESREWELARRLARTVSVDHPQLPPAALEWAESALAAGQGEEARAAAERAATLAPRSAAVRLAAARSAEAAGDVAAAIAHAREVVRLAPAEPEGVLCLAELLTGAKEATEALAALDAVTRRGARDPRLAAVRARALLATGRGAEAAPILDRLIAGRAESEWLVTRAEVRVAAGRSSHAKDDLRVVLEQDPRHLKAWRKLAGLLENGGRTEEAKECRDRAARIETENRAAERAMADWRAAPRDPAVAARAVEALLAAGRRADAGRVTRLADGFGRRP